MLFSGGYRYPSKSIFLVLSLLAAGVTVVLLILRDLSPLQAIQIFASLEGTVMVASSLSPVGLQPPPKGLRGLVKWLFENRFGAPMSYYQPLLYGGLLVLFAGIVVSAFLFPPLGGKAVDQAGVHAALEAQARTISPADADAIASFIDLPARWNRAAAPLVRDYLDPNVPADRWVRDASRQVAELRAVHAEMRACALAIQDPGIKQTFQEVTANYRAKLDCVTALHNAVAHGDHEAEQEAQQALSEASAEGQKLAQALIESLRPYVDPQVLSDELKKRGKAIGELMKPR